MTTRRLLPPFILGLSLTLVFLILSAPPGSEPAAALASPGIRYVATRGVDAGACTLPESPCRTVQYAVDVASPADEIWVASGVYTSVKSLAIGNQVVFINKPVIIRGGYSATSWNRPGGVASGTILDAMGQGRVVSIIAARTVVLDGLGITGGDASGLGGGLNDEAAGGGIYSFTSTLWINNSWIAGNKADAGGGVFLSQSHARFTGNTIAGNIARINGGGIYLSNSPTLILDGNSVVKNVARRNGGGLILDHSQALLDGNTVADNRAPYGGGLGLEYSAASLIGNVIRRNGATQVIETASSYDGGGLAVSHSDAVLDNNVIAENSAAGRGAGLFVWASRLRLRHTTLAGNTGGDGSGLHVLASWDQPSEVALANTILVSHTVGVTATKSSTVTLEATLWGRGASANRLDVGGTGAIFTGTINLWDAPRFVDSLKGNYHIRPTSAAVDAGVDAGVDRDIDREHRPFGEAPDLGADELPLSVAGPATGANFVYTDTRGITLAIEVPAEAVTRTTRLIFTPVITLEEPVAPSMRFGGRAFDLDAYWDGALRTGFTFRAGVTVTLQYSNTDVAEIDERTLRLYYWNAAAGGWLDAATTCTPPSRYRRSVERNVLQVPICHLSRYSIMGAGAWLYLPVLLR
ncbi:MAG: right-handed parallel beta-helix repeat-containing protein [Ardenticatenaceae bacterium]|nr:right-handed parallel beta-helix repeat-containing protein [Ardenticatenaceae bacterium]HBY94994.1 hypothetical protein [Chloroflexota bacterium]